MIAGKSELQLFEQPAKQVVVNNASFVDYLPVSALGDGVTSLDFYVQPSDVDYFDLNDSFIYVKLKVTNADGSDLVAASTCKPVNYMLNALFSDAQLWLNETLIEGGSQMYPYKSTIESIFGFTEDAKQIQLKTAGYSEDENQRKKWIATSQEFELVGAIRLDFFNQPKYVLNNVSMRLQLMLNKSTFVLMADAADKDTVDPKIHIKAARLYVRRAKVDDAVRLGHEIGLRSMNAMYPYQRSEVVTATIPANNHFFTKDNLLGHSQIPKFLVIGLVESEAFKGDYKKDPFMFNTFSVMSLGLYRDGESAPFRKIYEPDYDKKLFRDTYFKSIILNTQHFNTNANNGIRLKHFKTDGGYTFYTFNLAPDFDMDQCQQIADGNLRLDIRLKQQTKVAINVVVYALFDDVVQITKDRRVIKG